MQLLVESLPTRCAGCRAEHKMLYGRIQRAIVAVSSCSNGAVAIFATPGFEGDCRDGKYDAGDVLDVSALEPGLYVWEGSIVVCHHEGTPNGGEEWDVEHQGAFRPLTEAEWAAVREDRIVWPVPDVPHTCDRSEE